MVNRVRTCECGATSNEWPCSCGKTKSPKITEGKLKEMFAEDHECLSDYKKDSTLLGLNILAKYCPKSGVESAAHDQIWGVDVDEAIKAGLTEEDALELAKLNWMIDCDSFSSFV